MRKFALVIVLLVFAWNGYRLMGKLDDFMEENEQKQEEKGEKLE